ncbi:MAG: HEAT repeat domain-containing protein [Acidimicrobiales bacterium]
MAVTMHQVVVELDRDEPRYDVLARFGPAALPHLRLIVGADDPLRAAKAAYAASLIAGPASLKVLNAAADHPDPQVRVAVAHGLQNRSESAPDALLEHLLDDSDVGVRKVALGSAGTVSSPQLRRKIAAMAEDDPQEFVRNLAANVRDQP